MFIYHHVNIISISQGQGQLIVKYHKSEITTSKHFSVFAFFSSCMVNSSKYLNA